MGKSGGARKRGSGNNNDDEATPAATPPPAADDAKNNDGRAKGGDAGAKGAKGKKGKKGGDDDGPELPTWRLAMLDSLSPLCAGFLAAVYFLRREGMKGPLHQMAVKATRLSHAVEVDGETRYTRGEDDVYLVVFLIVLLTFLRGVAQSIVFRPLARLMGVKGAGDTHKYCEMGWQFVWYTTAWVSGWTLANAEWDIWDLRALWQGYPHDKLTPGMKLYYLAQLAFWLHMIFVTVLEKWRKDFVEMMAHHFITSGLVGSSYYFNFTRVGTLILVEQDLADILLPVAKMFNYAKMTSAADAFFALFAVTWIPTRHGIFMCIYYSVLVHANEELAYKWDPENGYYWTANFRMVYLVALGVFQCLMLFWLNLLLKAVFKALKGEHVEDERSDDEAEDKAKAKDKGKGPNGGKKDK